MSEPDARGAPPVGGGPPPVPPATGEPARGPDPSDPGPPIAVRVDGVPLGDLGNPRVDARLLTAILLQHSAVARWLNGLGVTLAHLETAFPGCGWPLDPPLGWPHQPRDPRTGVDVALDDLQLGVLGRDRTDGRLLWAIATRDGRVSRWLTEYGLVATAVEAAFPDARLR